MEDTGIGISRTDLGRLFVEFQQLDASTAKKYQGTGLGLALTKRIVEAQGGQVGVHSTVDKGSTFFALLPRVFSGQAVPATLLIPESNGRNGDDNGKLNAPKLLVIEDDSNDRNWLTDSLTRAGYDVECVTTGSEAILRCQEQKYDGITLDFFLPDMTGRDILRAIHTGGRNQQTPVILVTVATDKGLAAGFTVHDILAKPARADELFQSLDRAGLKQRKLGSNKVLVVDDDVSVLKTLEVCLREQGYEPICMLHGSRALEAVERHRPQAVVLDLIMPTMDGFQFLAHLRASAAGRYLPVIIFTSKDLGVEEQTCLRTLAQGTVSKSQGNVELLQQLRAHLSRPNGAASAAAKSVLPPEKEYANAC